MYRKWVFGNMALIVRRIFSRVISQQVDSVSLAQGELGKSLLEAVFETENTDQLLSAILAV